jgi:hypothetical protein
MSKLGIPPDIHVFGDEGTINARTNHELLEDLLNLLVVGSCFGAGLHNIGFVVTSKQNTGKNTGDVERI